MQNTSPNTKKKKKKKRPQSIEQCSIKFSKNTNRGNN